MLNMAFQGKAPVQECLSRPLHSNERNRNEIFNFLTTFQPF